jgi:hypothetical protein
MSDLDLLLSRDLSNEVLRGYPVLVTTSRVRDIDLSMSNLLEGWLKVNSHPSSSIGIHKNTFTSCTDIRHGNLQRILDMIQHGGFVRSTGPTISQLGIFSQLVQQHCFCAHETASDRTRFSATGTKSRLVPFLPN